MLPSAANSMSVPPPPPCSPSGKGGEEDTRVHSESSLLVSSPDTGPSEGGGGVGGEWERGAGAEAADLEAGEHGVMVFGTAALPEWQLGSLLRSA